MSKLCFLIDEPSFSARQEDRMLTGFDEGTLNQKLIRAGISPKDIVIESLSTINPNEAYEGIIASGDRALTAVTGKASINKWHLSPLDTLPDFKCRRAIATYSIGAIKKDWSLSFYFELALKRMHKYASLDPWERKIENYLLNPPIDQAIATLESIRHKEWHSIDIETGRNQINTFGVAWSPNDAIAIKVLPGDYPPHAFKKLWDLIADLCESDTAKVMQNGIFERLYLSRYGIQINNFKHDTMVAQKFLWPEFEKGLDNVGRIYTMEPYWKDDGRIASEEGKRKDWGNIRDWEKHLIYNCRDTSNTLIASLNQRDDLKSRGLLELYDGYLRKLFDPIYEMCNNGLPLNKGAQERLIAQYEAKSKELINAMSKPINPRSVKEKKAFLKSKGYVLPVKRSTGAESTDELSLKRLRLKYPDDNDLKALINIAGIEKALSSYLRVKTLEDNTIRYMIDPHGTETGRFSSSKDPWDCGFNGQTMPSYVKEMVEWTNDSNRIFIEIDLSQAESRFVAYDACEETLMGMLERREDIHRFVAAEIYQKPMADITDDERQLGKKSGHGANYSMGVRTFMDSCLKEMDLVLTQSMAYRVLEAYHKLFPGIRRWHSRIKSTVYRERKLDNPFGRVRYFYGRCDDNTYREAYAYRPQSTIPDITNHLMLSLLNKRVELSLDFKLHLQVHDSLLLSATKEHLPRICEYAKNTKLWHPDIRLPAGQLIIPTDVKTGKCLGRMTKWQN